VNFDPTIADTMMEAAKEPIANIVNPPTRSTGRFFGDTLDFWFSNREFKYAKKKIMDEAALRKFREECEAEFAKIPEDELVPPRKALLLPALDAAEYFVEEEELRQMFARLIAATCDMRKASKVHPSFKVIIQELSPLDAQNLVHIKSYQYEVIAQIKQTDFNYNKQIYETYILPTYYLHENFRESDVALQSVSINVLSKLGLIDLVLVPENKGIYDHLFEEVISKMREKSKTDSFELILMSAKITDLGNRFYSICLPHLFQEATP